MYILYIILTRLLEDRVHRPGVFWREPRALTPPSWINRRAEVWNESTMYPREMETGSKERDGGGDGKSLAYERGTVRGERFW